MTLHRRYEIAGMYRRECLRALVPRRSTFVRFGRAARLSVNGRIIGWLDFVEWYGE